MKVVQLTSVHPREDTRIFKKICKSLQEHDYEVNFIVADGKGNEVVDNIIIHDVGKPLNRINRVTFTQYKILKLCRELDCKIYHLHDPELIIIGRILKNRRNRIIYDVHEDLPRQLLHKPYIKSLPKIFINLIDYIEIRISKKFDLIIAATDKIKHRFLNSDKITVHNFPFITQTIIPNQRSIFTLCYVGSISKARGVDKIIECLDNFDNIKLELVGNFDTEEYMKYCISLKGWNKVTFHGRLDHDTTQEIISNSDIGMSLLELTPAYIDSIPTKLLEYMSKGVPFISSNLKFAEELVQNYQCGIIATNQKEIESAISFFMLNSNKRKEFGNRGKKAARSYLSWANESKQLMNSYNNLFN